MAQDDALSVDDSESTGDSGWRSCSPWRCSCSSSTHHSLVQEADSSEVLMVVAANVGLGLALVGLKVFLAH